MRVSGKLLIDCVIGLGKRDTGDLGPPSPADGRGDLGGTPAPGDTAPLLLSPLPAPGLGAAAPCCSWEAVLTVLEGLSFFVTAGEFGPPSGAGVCLGQLGGVGQAGLDPERLYLVGVWVARMERPCILPWLLR